MSANPDGVIPNPAKPQSTQLPNQTQAEIQPTPVRDLLFSSPSALSPLPLSSRTTPSAQSLQRPNQNPTTLPANAGEGSAFLRALRLATAIAPSFPLLPRPQIPHQPLKPLFVLVMTLPLPKIPNMPHPPPLPSRPAAHAQLSSRTAPSHDRSNALTKTQPRFRPTSVRDLLFPLFAFEARHFARSEPNFFFPLRSCDAVGLRRENRSSSPNGTRIASSIFGRNRTFTRTHSPARPFTVRYN
jgi:hypothetical protein